MRPTPTSESIAPVSEVLLPPEEIRKQRLRRVAMASAAAVLAGLSAYTIYYFAHASSVESRALAAGRTGRLAAIDDALNTLGAREAPGLRARLVAMAVLAGERPLEDADAALAAVPESDEHEAAERHKAEVYLRLAQGDVAGAMQAASVIIAAGTFAAETVHAKSLANYAAGNPGAAVAEAEAAVSVHDGPRYGAQLALSQALAGDVDAALTRLDADESGSPAVLAASARVRADARRDGATEAANAVLGDDGATRSEKAWAHLVRAIVGQARGATEVARAEMAEARSLAPPGDADFRWRAAEVAASIGDLESARSLAEEGGEGPIPAPPVRGRAQAAMALASGDSAAALRTLAQVPASPSALLLAGRAHEDAGAHDAARQAYTGVAGTPGWEAEAFAGRVRVELASEQAEAALSFARQALAKAPLHPRVVVPAVAALLANEESDEALRVAAAAVEARPSDVDLLEAQGDAQLAAERWSDALATLRRAAEENASRASVQAKLGEAARRSGEGAEARRAYEAALAIDDDLPLALGGLLALDLEEHEIEHAATLVERIEAADVEAPWIVLLRVQYEVAAGTGRVGLRYLRRVRRRRGVRGSNVLRIAMAELQMQAELYRQAIGMFGQAIRFGGDPVDMHIGRAIAFARDGRTRDATDALQLAREAGRPEGAPEDAPSSAEERPRMAVARGFIEYNVGRPDRAEHFARQALEGDPNSTEAQLILGESLARRRRSPVEALRAAIGYPTPQPKAFAILARRQGSTEEGCAFAKRYTETVIHRGVLVEDMERILDRCH